MTLKNAINNALVNNGYFVVEVVGAKEYKVTQIFAYLEDAQKAKRRMTRQGGHYVVKTARGERGE